MIPEQQKTKVFFSELFCHKYPKEYEQIDKFLAKAHVVHGCLKNTLDYWCRDYMPIHASQTECRLFTYDPDYLKGQEEYRTDAENVIKGMSKDESPVYRRTPLVVDGGNFVVCEGSSAKERNSHTLAIMTEKVFVENPQFTQKEIEQILQDSFPNTTFVFIPWDRTDKCGHTDGIVHNLGNGRILVNLKIYPKKIADEMRQILERYFTVIDLQLSRYSQRSWAYINMLQTKDIIIIPGIGEDTDQEAFEQICKLHPEYGSNIYMLNIRNIVNRWGGALNCLSWTTM